MNMKESYRQKLQAQLDQWSAEIDKLKARAEKADADIRLEYFEQIEDLKVKQQAATDKLDELMSASDDAWEELKAGVESARFTLGEAVERAAARFK
jgi:predicted nuclease with TOPRIM domain